MLEYLVFFFIICAAGSAYLPGSSRPDFRERDVNITIVFKYNFEMKSNKCYNNELTNENLNTSQTQKRN